MADIWSSDKRSKIMSMIRSKDTKPEKAVRSMLRSAGIGFRIHRSDLPGRPDIVLSKYKSVIFVNGCFWHGHENCRNGTIPLSNRKFWEPKLRRNVERDRKVIQLLTDANWKTLVIWECAITKRPDEVKSNILSFLNVNQY